MSVCERGGEGRMERSVGGEGRIGRMQITIRPLNKLLYFHGVRSNNKYVLVGKDFQ